MPSKYKEISAGTAIFTISEVVIKYMWK